MTVPMRFGRHRTNVPLIAMHYRKLTALALFIYAATAAPQTAASKRDVVAPKEDAFPAVYTSGFSAASKDTHEWDIIDGFTGVFGDPQAQSIEEDGTVGVKYLVTQ